MEIQVELVPVKSAQERDALIQAAEIDGALSDLQGVAIFNRETPQLKVVAKARKAYADAPHFRIVAAPGFEVNGPEDMAGVPVGRQATQSRKAGHRHWRRQRRYGCLSRGLRYGGRKSAIHRHPASCSLQA